MAARRASILATQGSGALPWASGPGLPKRGFCTSKRTAHHLDLDSRRPEPERALPPRWPPPLAFFVALAPKAKDRSNFFLPGFLDMAHPPDGDVLLPGRSVPGSATYRRAGGEVKRRPEPP